MTPITDPKERCPCCSSDQLIISDDGSRSASQWSVVCRDCGCKGYEHCTRPLAILCWDGTAREMREIAALAKTLGWTWALPEPSIWPMSVPS